MSACSQSLSLDCPAKINLSLSILGPQADGFHALVSVVCQVGLADTLHLDWDAEGAPESDFVQYVTASPEGGVVESSLVANGADTVSRAIRIFREETGLRAGAFTFTVEKRIPSGAGLGGGSSDGANALRTLQAVTRDTLGEVDLPGMAAAIGSDCPLFLLDGPVLMEGRGERITPLEPALADRLSGLSVFLFKPSYGIQTAEAYRRLAARQCYSPGVDRENLLQAWRDSGSVLPMEGNDFQRLCSFWMPDLAVVLDRLNAYEGQVSRLSGSGSACFLISRDADKARPILEKELCRAWGDSFWMMLSVLK